MWRLVPTRHCEAGHERSEEACYGVRQIGKRVLRQDATTRSRLSRYWSRPRTILRPKKKASSNVGPARSLDRTQEDVTLTELTENHWEDRAKEIGQKPQVPVLSPEEKQATVAAYRALPQDRKDLFKRLIQHPCAYCEKEFNVPNVGLSHGICERHKKEQYAQMGMMDKYKPNPNNQTVDLKELSPEELKLAVNLFAIVRAKEKDKLAKRTDLAKAA